jgi:hypothetical protein
MTITNLAEISQAGFEEVYENIWGFRRAQLQAGPGSIWGETPENALITQIDLDLRDADNSYSWVGQFSSPYFNISLEFGDLLSELFAIFYDDDNFQDFSEVAISSTGDLDFQWEYSGVIIINMTVVGDGGLEVYSIMEDSRDWESEQNFSIATSWQYINYCHERYERFAKHFTS